MVGKFVRSRMIEGVMAGIIVKVTRRVAFGGVRTVLVATIVIAIGLTLKPSLVTVPLMAQSVAVGAQPETENSTEMVSLDVRDVALEGVLRLISQRAGLTLFYPDKRVLVDKMVTVRLRDVAAGDAFTRVLTGTGMHAVIEGRRVFVKPIDATSTSVVQGGIAGKVIDRATKHPLHGVLVVLDDAAKGVTSGDDGEFHISNVAPGRHTLRVRMLGYLKVAKTLTIVDGQTATLEIGLEPGVSALDQVVVTGTVVAIAQREIPNAMTIITAKELEQRGITKIDQLFRGDVPGVFAVNQGSHNPLDQVLMFSRGATALSTTSAGTTNNTNPMKTYVDGVELADPSYLNQIDPKSIERIEIVTGPQASTIYGSNAINGVMQVFTKRGTSAAARPQFTATLLSGWVENNFRPTRTPQHDDAAQVAGVEGHWAYNAGGSWYYMGPWTPGKQTARLSGFGGARIQRGPITADGSLRLATTRNWSVGGANQSETAFRERGWYTPSYSNGNAYTSTQTLAGQTLGLSLGVAPVSWWSHELVLGVDRSAQESQGTTRRFQLPSDTLLALTQSTMERRSVRYASTVQGPLASVARAVVTVGADAWQSLSTSLNLSALALTGALTPSGTPGVTRLPAHNAGGFLQAQVGFWDQLFVTYGLRAEWNPTYGEDAQPNWAPRYGMAVTRDVETPWGVVTAKVRGSYGRSTRPPTAGASAAQTVTTYWGALTANSSFIPWYGDYEYVKANPELGPEHQQGGEGGLELYLGRRGSLVVTRFNQTITNLIARVVVDSVRSLDPANKPSAQTSCDAVGYCYYGQSEYLNVGAIRNQGWELQGTMVTGPLTTRGTYSWTKSRTIGVNPRYLAFFTPASYPQYQPGASFQYLPEHTWSESVTYARARSMVALNVSGTGMLRTTNTQLNATRIGPSIRLSADRWLFNSSAFLNQLNAGYVLADLNASQRFSSRVEGVMQMQNLGDVYRNDVWAAYATLGRQTKLGLRVRL